VWHRRIFQSLRRCFLCCNKAGDGLVSWVLALSQFCMSFVFAGFWHLQDIIPAFPTQTFPFSRFRIPKHFVPQSSFIEHQACLCVPHLPECLLIFSPLPKNRMFSQTAWRYILWNLVTCFLYLWMTEEDRVVISSDKRVIWIWLRVSWKPEFNIKQWKKFTHKKALCLSAGMFGNN